MEHYQRERQKSFDKGDITDLLIALTETQKSLDRQQAMLTDRLRSIEGKFYKLEEMHEMLTELHEKLIGGDP